MMTRLFKNRAEAGQLLAAELLQRKLIRPVIVALPRGGVPVAYEIAQALKAPLEILLVRKIGAPGQPELAIGAVADGEPPHVVIDQSMLQMLEVDDAYVNEQTAHQIAEIERRRKKYGITQPQHSLAGRTAILVDDGIATGATTHAALLALHERKPASVVLAAPTAARDSYKKLMPHVDEFICLNISDYFRGVGGFYTDFTQVEDEVVIEILKAANVQNADLTKH